MVESVSENSLQNKLICCNFCCETFSKLSSFKSHLINSHKYGNLPTTIYTTLKNSGKFLCKFCKKKFHSNEVLKKHI